MHEHWFDSEFNSATVNEIGRNTSERVVQQSIGSFSDPRYLSKGLAQLYELVTDDYSKEKRNDGILRCDEAQCQKGNHLVNFFMDHFEPMGIARKVNIKKMNDLVEDAVRNRSFVVNEMTENDQLMEDYLQIKA